MTKSYEINFKGGFLIKKPSTRMWNNIKKIMPRRKCVIENYNGLGDRFFAVKTHYDSEVGEMILKKRVDFNFYPDINLKSRLDAYFPEESRKIVEAQDRVISTRKELKKYLKSIEKPFKPVKYRWKPDDHIQKTLAWLGLKESDCNIEIKNGITYIYDKVGKLIAKASPNGQKGTNFIYKLPDKNEVAKRVAIDMTGEECWNFKAINVADFWKNFLLNVKIDLKRIRPQK